MGLLVSLLVISFLIFFHELGHFLAARYFGVRVDVFSIGFGKKIYSKKIGDTEYVIAAIPLGGYVKMRGQDDMDPKSIDYRDDSYGSKPPYQRLIILFAGAFANFLLAFFLYIAIGFMGERVLSPIVGEVKEGFPAYNAGVRSNDRIVAINNQEIREWRDVSKLISVNDKRVVLLIERDRKRERVVLTPRVSESKNIFGETIIKPLIGILPSGEVESIRYSVSELPSFAINKTIEDAKMILLGLQKLIQGIISPSEIGGVISIVQITSEASMMGIVVLFSFTALISVNLGILNLLPIPALDGGHMIFTLYEMIFGKKPNEEILYKLTLGGWAILISLMLLGLYNDINRLTSGGGVLP